MQTRKFVVNAIIVYMITFNQVKTSTQPILRRHEVKKAAVFGSVARGEANPQDVDLLVEFDKRVSLLDLSRLKLELESKVNRRVDLVTYDSVHPLLQDIIFKEQRVIYE